MHKYFHINNLRGLKPKYIALTFDDGYEKHYEIAKLLYRLDIPATFFVITHLKIFEGKRLLTNNYAKLREIHDMGHEIASHSCTHINLIHANESRVLYEVYESKKVLEDILGESIDGFAYPYGAFNHKVMNIVRMYYKYARGLSFYGADPYNLTINVYAIGAITPKHTLKLIRDLRLRKKLRFLVIYTHTTNKIETLALISYLKMLFPDSKFVTMKELSNFVKYNI